MAPLVHAVVSKLKEISPTQQDSQALRELQAVQKKLKDTEAQLRKSQQSRNTPSLPEAGTPSDTGVASQDLVDAEEPHLTPGEATPWGRPAEIKKRKVSAAALGASPKAKSQRGLDAWVKRAEPPAVAPPEPLTAPKVMNPSKPVLRDHQTKSTSQGDLKKWMEQFDVETQQCAKKILELVSEQKYSKAKLQNAAAQYGLNVQDSLKLAPKSLQQVI